MHMRSHNEEKMNASKKCGIFTRKDQGDRRELIEREAANKWSGQPIGGVSWPHMSGFQGHHLRYDFYRLSNPKKYIFAL